MAKGADLYGSGLLGETLAPEKSGKLSERFMVPPFSVLNCREGFWQERKRAWLSLGIQSELGRGESVPTDFVAPAGADRDMAPPQQAPAAPAAAPKARVGKPAHTVTIQKPVAVPRGDKAAPVIGGLSFTLPPSDWRPPQELPSLEGIKRLCVDVETRDPNLKKLGLGVRRGDAYVVGLAIGADDGRRWYFPVRHEGGGNLDEGLVKRWAKEELTKFSGELVGANLVYDMDFLEHKEWGVQFRNVKAFHDIQIAEPLIDEWRFKYDLDSIAQTYLGERKNESLLRDAVRALDFDDVKANLWRLPANYVGPYAEGDVDLPLRILPLQLAKLAEEGLENIYLTERKLIPCMLAMKQRGVKINVAKAEQARAELVVRRDEALSNLKRLAGSRAEFMAPNSFENALRDRGLQLQYTEGTENSEPQLSVTKEWLEANSHDELCKTLAIGRKANTSINTFFDGTILGHLVGDRIHCTFHQLKGDDGGTIARFSSADPNLQNLPARDEEMAQLTRTPFEPDSEDEEWERQDQSQVEYRLLANFAVGDGAEQCRQNYINNPKTDYHKFCAEMCKIDPEDKIKRKRVKNINFAKGYGAGAKKLAGQMKCSIAEAEEFIQLYDGNLPFAKATFNAAMTWAKNRGFVTSILGRKQRFPLWEPMGYQQQKKKPLPREAALKEYGPRIQRYKTYAALNRKLQSSGADIMKQTMVMCLEAGVFSVLGAPLLTVHDELDWSVPKTAAGNEAALEAKRIGETCVKLKVPLMVDCSRGPNWGACD